MLLSLNTALLQFFINLNQALNKYLGNDLKKLFYYLAFAWSLVVLNFSLNYLNKDYFVSLFGVEFSIFISLFVIFISLFALAMFWWIKYRLLGIYVFVIPFIVSIVFLVF